MKKQEVEFEKARERILKLVPPDSPLGRDVQALDAEETLNNIKLAAFAHAEDIMTLNVPVIRSLVKLMGTGDHSAQVDALTEKQMRGLAKMLKFLFILANAE